MVIQQKECACGITNWFRFALASDDFSVFMPVTPTLSVTTNKTAVGPLVISVYTSEVSPTTAFTAVRNSFPTNLNMTDTKKLFAGGLKQALSTEGHLIYDREVSLGKYPGREWRFDKYRGQAVVTMRAYLVGHELFQAICVMPKSGVCQGHVRDFLDSCEIRKQ